MERKIVVVGSANTDLVMNTERIPVPGETIIGGSFMVNAGGKGANQAVAAARLGGSVVFIAKVGMDDYGRNAKKAYASEGIDISCVFDDPVNHSGVAFIIVDKAAENCIVVAPGANSALSTGDIDSSEKVIRGAEYMLVQLEVPMAIVEYAVDMAHRHGVKVILNPAPAAPLSDNVLGKIDILTPNRVEAELISGVKVVTMEDAKMAAEAIHRMGVRDVLITLGADGVLGLYGGQFVHVPAFPVTPVDTTAAGDVFNGALAVALSKGWDMERAIAFGCRASAIAVTRLGAQSSIPTKAEVEMM